VSFLLQDVVYSKAPFVALNKSVMLFVLVVLLASEEITRLLYYVESPQYSILLEALGCATVELSCNVLNYLHICSSVHVAPTRTVRKSRGIVANTVANVIPALLTCNACAVYDTVSRYFIEWPIIPFF